MNRPARVFLLVSGGILLGGLGTGLVAFYMGGLEPAGLRGAPDELAYVSADAQVVAFADIRAGQGSALRDVVTSFGTRGQASRLRAETGIDLERDVERLLAIVDRSDAGSRDGRPLLLARGRFDRDRVELLVQAHGGALQEYRGRRLLAYTGANIGLAFVEPDLVALGTPGGVRRALDVRHGARAGIRSDAELMRQVRGVHGGAAWAVVRGSAMGTLHQHGLGFPPAMGPAAGWPGFSWLVASSQMDGSIRGHLKADAVDERSARAFREALRGAVAKGRMQADRPEWADFINSLEPGGQGRTVSVGFAIPAGMMQSLRHGQPLPPPAVHRPLPPRPWLHGPQAPRGFERHRPQGGPRRTPARVAWTISGQAAGVPLNT